MMFQPGEVYIVMIAPDGTKTAYRLKPETVQLQMKNDYSFHEHIFAPSPVSIPMPPPTILEVSGVMDEGRAWTPGATPQVVA